MAYEFPSTWSSSIKHWWSASKSAGALAEEALIRRGLGSIPLIQPNDTKNYEKRALLRRIDLTGHPTDKNYFLNVLEVGSSERKSGEHAFVVGHGYGNGLAFFWQNYAAMTSVPNTRTFFMDWLGMGRSGRPAFPSIKHFSSEKATEEDMRKRVSQAEEFFIGSLEDFRRQEGLQTMTLIGHSIGGLLSAAYALKYPQHVEKLILISPVGVPESPYEQPWHRSGPNGKIKMSQSKEDELNAQALEQQIMPASTPGEEELPKDLQKFEVTWWSRLWEANVSPFTVLRGASFLGPSLLSRYASRRFKAFPEEVQSELFDYLYHISTNKGSGEYCLAHLLAPGAYARWPLIKRLGRLDIPITFIYGDNDWMDKNGGYDMLSKLKAKPQSPVTELQKKRSRVLINPHSGHWVFLENPKGFDSIIVKEIQEAVRDSKN